jgi:hypothetical protein
MGSLYLISLGFLSPVAAQQAPAFEHGERGIEATVDLGMAAGRTDVLDGLQLSVGCPAAPTLELDGVELAR